MLKRCLVLLAALLISLSLAGLLGVGWYYSDVLRDGALAVDHSPLTPDLVVKQIDEDSITLAVSSATDMTNGAWLHDGIWGMEWDGGYARVGKILARDDDSVTREYIPSDDTLAVGEQVRLDSFAFHGSPAEALGLQYAEVQIASEGNNFPAWFLEGDDDTWAIFVHGMDSDRQEALRALGTFVDQRLPSLVITYRNDAGLPPSLSGYYDYGRSEWPELEAAVRFAKDNGASEVVLVGYSMGGAIIASFLKQSEEARAVAGLVLDAPMLDFSDAVSYGAEQRGLPGTLTWVGKQVSALRFGIHWGELDYLSTIDSWDFPVLLFHGEADTRIPIRISERLAQLRPDIVTFVPVPAATHVRAWNLHPQHYEQSLAEFVSQFSGGRSV